MDQPKALMHFPDTFEWGVATAAYQIEGGAFADGRGPSIWDDFSHTPNHVLHGDTGDIACDHYHRLDNDVALLQMLGVSHYRFSISWPRVFPDGRLSSVNSKGLDFYQRLIDALLAHDIIPTATLYHWDLPSTLQAQGGWQNRDTAQIFADYAGFMVQALGDRVGHWITHNEPWCAAVLGHETGEHAPGIKDPAAALSAAHHILLSHGLAALAMRAVRPAASIGITLNLSMVYGHDDTRETEEAVTLQDVFSNRWFLDPIFYGRYPGLLETIYGHMPPVKTDDMASIAQPLDFLGVNYYSAQIVAGRPGSHHPWPVQSITANAPVTAMGWSVMPHGLHDLLLQLSQNYPTVPLIITENGAAYPDTLNRGMVIDSDRIRYLSDHIDAVGTAIGQGADVRGYYVWSLMDNFEWGYGYGKRFGLFYVDFETLERLPKDSARWYRDLLRRIHAHR